MSVFPSAGVPARYGAEPPHRLISRLTNDPRPPSRSRKLTRPRWTCRGCLERPISGSRINRRILSAGTDDSGVSKDSSESATRSMPKPSICLISPSPIAGQLWCSSYCIRLSRAQCFPSRLRFLPSHLITRISSFETNITVLNSEPSYAISSARSCYALISSLTDAQELG
ncbi:hypothetical protein PGTUg99_005192 [Puccinia graminis f. sp. tritici]|uniref:Uncharacterized protein n=1 Tax=Puccinia graminis f. sp. tritici TaxID=56615 RepID=A0A5B0RE23_PUCGR|nr:hypothetical protein PGTUg99_005192 [Puccinia graminis f. sp. tritici]